MPRAASRIIIASLDGAQPRTCVCVCVCVCVRMSGRARTTTLLLGLAVPRANLLQRRAGASLSRWGSESHREMRERTLRSMLNLCGLAWNNVKFAWGLCRFCAPSRCGGGGGAGIKCVERIRGLNSRVCYKRGKNICGISLFTWKPCTTECLLRTYEDKYYGSR